MLDELKTKPWAHQVGAIEYALQNRAALLHMHMGTGKTKVALDTCFISSYNIVLIICPKAVMRVWPIEIEKHYAGIASIVILDGPIKNRVKMLDQAAPHPTTLFFIINYEGVWRTPLNRAIASKAWDCIIFDESHRIKSHSSKVSKFCAQLDAEKKLALTGTPMPHSPLDIFGQYRALDPSIFGSYWTPFKNKFARVGGPQGNWITGAKNLEELGRITNTIRYEVKDDALDLPDMIEQDIVFALDSEAKNYREMENLFITEIRGEAVTASNALVKMLRLQQITSGYLPLENRTTKVGKSKLSALEDLLDGIDSSEPVVIFARFIHDISSIKELCNDLGRRAGEVSGNRKDLDEWDNEEIDTLVVQMQSGSEGIDLTRSRYVIWYSMGFSRGQYDQACARCHRPGQQRTVHVLRLLAQNTIDQRIVKSLVKRKEAVDKTLRDDLAADILDTYQGEAIPF